MAVPRGYHELVQQPDKDGLLRFLICNKCGSPVMYPKKHDEWHKKNG